jgi:hypothetical protein
MLPEGCASHGATKQAKCGSSTPLHAFDHWGITMGETSIAGLFLALALLIVISGPARLIRLASIMKAGLHTLWRGRRRGTAETAAGE